VCFTRKLSLGVTGAGRAYPHTLALAALGFSVNERVRERNRQGEAYAFHLLGSRRFGRMSPVTRRQVIALRNFIVACCIGVAAAAVVGWSGLMFGPQDESAAAVAVSNRAAPESRGAEPFAADGIALRYAAAVQEGNDAEVIRMTWWMTERLERVRMATDNEEAWETAYQGLCKQIGEWSVEGSQIRPEGIEDQYIFVPGATFEVAGVDAGRTNLAKEVGERTWIRVTYPVRSRAPRDRAGEAIRRLTVGVNVSRDGYVLKSGVIGNLDIEWESFSYDWPPVEGG